MDIDFNTILTGDRGDMSIEVGNQQVSGNRALANQFEITLLTNWRRYFYPETETVSNDTFGGNSLNYIGPQYNTSDKASIMASMTAAVNNAVDSIKTEQQDMNLPATERLQSANVTELYVKRDIIYSVISVVPEQLEPYSDLKLNLPIIKVKE